MITEINVFDCDGVLLDSSHRYATKICDDGLVRIDLDYWIEREHMAYSDSPLKTGYNEYMQSVANPNAYTIIATAAIVCQNRIECLRDKLALPDYIIGRNGRTDTRGGAELKISGLRKLLQLKQFHVAKNNLTMYEDNISYLSKICTALHCRGVYIPSDQGH